MTYTLRIAGSPPSKANSYRIEKRGRHMSLVKQAPCIAYEDDIVKLVTAARETYGWDDPLFPAQETVAVAITWHRSSMRPRDLDNIYKAVLDGLTQGKVWADDSQVTHIDGRMIFDAGDGEEWLDISFQIDPVDPGIRWHNHQAKKAKELMRKSALPPPSLPLPTSKTAGRKPRTKSAAKASGSESSSASPATSTSAPATGNKRSGTTGSSDSGSVDAVANGQSRRRSTGSPTSTRSTD